jgi:hypothetical protein
MNTKKLDDELQLTTAIQAKPLQMHQSQSMLTGYETQEFKSMFK